MVGLRLGGIDPSILRELSGVYKPFVKAFKELVSNAFDADADHAVIEVADDFSSISLSDDGVGMSPFEFRSDFTRIGGGSRKWASERTDKGRLRIGNKGIGFLALARYCSLLEVESSSERKYSHTIELPTTPATLDLAEVFGFPVPTDSLDGRLSCRATGVGRRKRRLKEGTDFSVDFRMGTIGVESQPGPVKVDLKLKCEGIRFKAVMDFDRLLELVDKADLEKLDDFATIEIQEDDDRSPERRTCITARNLKSFVRRELRADRRKGNVRNVSSLAGLNRFVWHLSRCTPVAYAEGLRPEADSLRELLKPDEVPVLGSLEFRHAKASHPIRRTIYCLGEAAQPLHRDMLIPIDIEEEGLRAVGFLAGYEGVVFPAEYRGISVRVRGVAIGEPGFFGAEHLVTGISKGALSQITGEINVLSGLDAVDSLNPGRESFYEESEHYKILHHRLLGEGEQVSGYLGEAIAAVIRRSQVRSALKDVLGRATLRRRALDDIAAAVAYFIASGDETGKAFLGLLKRNGSHSNGLASCAEFSLDAPPRVGGLLTVAAEDLPDPAEIDYESGQVLLDMARPPWDWSLVLFNRRFDVVNKRGGVNRPLAELDLQGDRILLNWEHPLRTQMDERGFLRTALSWLLAKEAVTDRADVMMEAGLRLMSFRTASSDA